MSKRFCPSTRAASRWKSGCRMKHAWARSAHQGAISTEVEHGSHAVVIIDGAGWHTTKALAVPSNISLLRLPPYSPAPPRSGLNPG